MCSGINAKPSSSVRDQLHYPHFALGQVSGYIGLNIQFHNLTFEQFVAGELETIHTCNDSQERAGRIDLLHQIAQWNLRTNVSWLQIRNTYAHILRHIENREVGWDTDWERYEKYIYDKVGANLNKNEKTKQQRQKIETIWFCKAFQKPEGCTRDSPHPGRVGNQFKQMYHICASCWLKDKIKRGHPESSPDCPHNNEH